jgi:hypothetical protein
MRMQKCPGTFVKGAVRDGMVTSGLPVIRPRPVTHIEVVEAAAVLDVIGIPCRASGLMHISFPSWRCDAYHIMPILTR